MAEVWREIEGFPGYKVSDQGRVKSLKYGKERILKLELSHKGYYRAALTIEGKTKKVSVHRLVAQAFIPNPLGLPEVNHLKGIKTDNRASELEWSTTEDNQKHAVETGLSPDITGKNNPRFDHTVYTFLHPEHGIFKGTQKDFKTTYQVKRCGLGGLMQGTSKSYKGWILKNG